MCHFGSVVLGHGRVNDHKLEGEDDDQDLEDAELLDGGHWLQDASGVSEVNQDANDGQDGDDECETLMARRPNVTASVKK